MKKVAAFFDIDGTLYRDSLLLDHFKKLIKYEIVPSEAYTREAKDHFNKWVNRQGRYDDYMLKTSDLYRIALIDLDKSYIETSVQRLITLNYNKVYTYTRDMIKWHIEQGHLIIFISGSPDFLVEAMAKKYNATDFRGSEYIVENNIFTGEVNPMWDRVSKTSAMNELIELYNIDLEKSYAYGDTNGDLFMLEKVGYPVAFNPSKELLNNLKSSNSISKNLKVIVERKDNIFNIDLSSDIY